MVVHGGYTSSGAGAEATNAVANTGSGGGGGVRDAFHSFTGTGGNGSAGVVIIKFPTGSGYSATGTYTATTLSNIQAGTIFSTTDTYKYYWWNGSTWSESG